MADKKRGRFTVAEFEGHPKSDLIVKQRKYLDNVAKRERPRSKRLEKARLFGGLSRPTSDPVVEELQEAARSRAITRSEYEPKYALHYRNKKATEMGLDIPDWGKSVGVNKFREWLREAEYDFAKSRTRYFLRKLSEKAKRRALGRKR